VTPHNNIFLFFYFGNNYIGKKGFGFSDFQKKVHSGILIQENQWVPCKIFNIIKFFFVTGTNVYIIVSSVKFSNSHQNIL